MHSENTANKSSAVAEIGDLLVAIDMGRKLGDCIYFFGGGSWHPI